MSSQTTDADACRADLLAGWVRMGMTARLRYLIDAGELAPVAKQVRALIFSPNCDTLCIESTLAGHLGVRMHYDLMRILLPRLMASSRPFSTHLMKFLSPCPFALAPMLLTPYSCPSGRPS